MTSLPRDENRVPVIGGVSSSDGSTPTPVEVNPTTGRTLVDTGDTSATLNSFQVNNLDDDNTTASVLYIGMVKDDGTWCIKKFDESTAATPVITYATVTNNPAVTTYATAWAAIATLTYNVYQTAF